MYFMSHTFVREQGTLMPGAGELAELPKLPLLSFPVALKIRYAFNLERQCFFNS
jgi:hypothetical protein